MNQQERLDNIIKAIDAPSKKDITLLFSDLRESIKTALKQFRDSVDLDMSSNMKDCSSMCSDVKIALKTTEKQLTALISDSSKKTYNEAYKALNNAIYGLERQIKDIPQFDSSILEEKWSVVIKDLQDKIDSFKQLTAQEIKNSLETLTGDERLDKSAIKGIEEIEKNIKNIELRPSGAVGARGIQLFVDGAKKGQVNSVNLIAGSGISLTFAHAFGRNDITISATGGSFSILTATGTVDDSNVDFTFVSKPTLIIINGAAYPETGGAITWSWNVGTLTATLSSPVGSSGNIYGL